ncbi:hypothetical protein ACTFIY_010529 [Dictyostelium cf. discoideum]
MVNSEHPPSIETEFSNLSITTASNATDATSAIDPIATNPTGTTFSNHTNFGGMTYMATPNRCYICSRTRTPYWRKGIYNGQQVNLCNPCGLNYMKTEKKSSSKV